MVGRRDGFLAGRGRPPSRAAWPGPCVAPAWALFQPFEKNLRLKKWLEAAAQGGGTSLGRRRGSGLSARPLPRLQRRTRKLQRRPRRCRRSRRRSGSGAGCFLQLQIAGERDGTSCEGEASVLLSTLLTHEEMPVSIALNKEDKKVFAKATLYLGSHRAAATNCSARLLPAVRPQLARAQVSAALQRAAQI